MRGLVLHGPGRVEWEDIDEPETPRRCGDRATDRGGTCDLDVAVLRGRHPAPGTRYVFGHEAIADVVAVGPDVRAFSPGDRVVVTFRISCCTCEPCRRRRTGNCRSHPRLSTSGLGIEMLIDEADGTVAVAADRAACTRRRRASRRIPDGFLHAKRPWPRSLASS
jgi:threonine dehydrogenase-like Zn-dependent dehydrogenase